MTTARKLLWAMAIAAIPALASAQGYYDDDIYYTPKNKSTSTDKSKAKAEQQTLAGQGYYYVPNTSTDFPSADTYTVNSGSTRDVDEYNRRGQFLVADTIIADSTQIDTFANTRLIERFHNEDIISSSNDADLAAYYYSSEPTTVNIYIDNDPWYSPYYNWTWRYGYPWYGYPWYYNSYWGPSWSWSWGWGPSWGWDYCWGPGWGHGWGHGWGPPPGHGPSWGNSHAWRPQPTPSGSSRPHNYAGGGSTRYPSATTTRPANSGYGSTAAPGGNTRPGHAAAPANGTVSRPTGGSSATPTVGTGNTRGRGNASASSSSAAPSRNTSTSSSSRGSSSSYGSGSSSSRGSSYSGGGSYGGGSRSTGGSYGGGGGSRSSGGGGGGGRGHR